jgi:L-ascorbate metabolism protein UlaG (beta-lactamase superfamily)
MELTWFGTACFRIDTGREIILIDPYLSRNADARPIIRLKPSDVKKADRILLTHGHFDHILDVPLIASKTGATVYSDPVTRETLIRNGLDPNRHLTVIEDGQSFDFASVTAQAYHSRHVTFDRRLLLGTLLRMNYKLLGVMKLLRDYPCGQPLSWRLTLSGKTLHHFGSGGSTPEELSRLASQRTDVALVPLQGNTNICQIAANYVRTLKPGIVIPHHQDDFFPPVSRMVDIEPFLSAVNKECPDTHVRVLKVGEPCILDL